MDWFVNHWNIDERDAALQGLWDNLEVAPQYSTEESFRQVQRRISAHHKSVRFIPLLQKIGRIAAILLLPLVSAGLIYFYTQYTNAAETSGELTECFVPHGKVQTIVLPDSSQVL
ncbi:MAG: hypothetical protein LBT61_01675, partial [Prevotellaceae bacterium]|nr:hypothetical protein [Prevotellaceae bacterium]